MAPDVAEILARLGQRGHATSDDDLVFLGDAGSYLDASALRRRYDRALKAAGLRPLRFHDLRHTFGTRMIARADIRRVQEWMGYADFQTTMRYLHYAPRHDDAALSPSASGASQRRDRLNRRTAASTIASSPSRIALTSSRTRVSNAAPLGPATLSSRLYTPRSTAMRCSSAASVNAA